MDWMLTHQLSSKNLTSGEKLAMVDEFKEQVRLENEKKKSEAIAESNRTRNSNTLQMECNENNRVHSDTWTDSQTSKKAKVGTGTVARYNKVMNSDDDELKQQKEDHVKTALQLEGGSIDRSTYTDNQVAKRLVLERIKSWR